MKTEAMETKHTKGEWLTKELAVYNAETGKTIAQVGLWGATREQEAEANAKLIAAAPDLLNALLIIYNEYKAIVNNKNHEAEITLAIVEHVIEKATL